MRSKPISMKKLNRWAKDFFKDDLYYGMKNLREENIEMMRHKKVVLEQFISYLWEHRND